MISWRPVKVPDAMRFIPLVAMVTTLAGGAVSIPEPAPQAAPGGPGLVIIAPRPIEIVSGRQAIEIAVPSPGPDGDAVVEVQVDGKAAGRLEHAPYKLDYDFGTA